MLIRIFTVGLLLVFSLNSGRAQDSTAAPFFSASCFESDAYFEFQGIISSVAKSPAGFTGFGLYWVVNHRFVTGASAFLLASGENLGSIYAFPDSLDDQPLARSYSAGLSFGYILFDQKKFSLHPELYAGWGMIKYQPYGSTQEWNKNFAVLWPKVQATWNAHKNFRLGLGLGYRAAIGASGNGLKSSDLGGPTGQVFIRVGTF